MHSAPNLTSHFANEHKQFIGTGYKFLFSKQIFFSYFIDILADCDKKGVDNNLAKSSSASRLQDMDNSESNFPNVPTAVSLIAQDDASDDVSNDSDPECSRVLKNLMYHITMQMALR